jgi:predicted PurR-regulated permease PerM
MYLITSAAIMALCYANNKKYNEKISLKVAIIASLCSVTAVIVLAVIALYLWLDDDFENFHPRVVNIAIEINNNWDDILKRINKVFNINIIIEKYTFIKNFFENN